MALWAVRLTGLLFLLGFIALCSFIHIPRIESDLQGKAVTALAAAGIDGATVSARGRDILLQLPSGSNELSSKARSIVTAIPGVRQVSLSADTPDASLPQATSGGEFLFSVTRQTPGGEILLSGGLPPNVEKSELIKALGAQDADLTIESADLNATGATVKGAPEILMVAAAASKELAPGEISIQGETIRVSGKPVHEQSIETIRKKFAPFLGLGYSLSLDIPVPANSNADSSQSAAGKEDAGSDTGASEAAVHGASLMSLGIMQQCQQHIDQILASSKIRFANGRATLRRSSTTILDALANAVSDCPDINILITGHTDATGSAAGNLRLSQQRANAVKTYLVSKGIDAERIKTAGKGSSEPVASNKTAAGRARNRRIEMTLEGSKQ